MAIKTIITEPNKILRQKSLPVNKVGKEEQRLMDVIATNPDNLSTVNIQVKTRTIDGRRSSWMMGRKNEQIHKNL